LCHRIRLPHPTSISHNVTGIGIALFSSFDKLRQYTANVPSSKPIPAWNRLANNIKDVDMGTTFSDQKHIEKLRVSFDPCDSISRLEDELMEEMANALGKTGRKCDVLFKLLVKLKIKYDIIDENDSEKNILATHFNEVRRLATDARRDLIIHRQCCGFTWQNHKIIMEEYPLPDKMKMI